MSDFDQAASYAIGIAKARGLAEVSLDELLLGSLLAVSRFGVVEIGSIALDLEELGFDWLDRPEKAGAKVSYSAAAVELLDRAARIARTDGGGPVQIAHVLAAFARVESGSMGELKRKHSITSAAWRAGVARLATSPAAEPSHAADDAPKGDYLTPEQAAEALGVHVQTVRGYVRSGKLIALRVAGERAIRIRRSDLESVLEPLVPQG